MRDATLCLLVKGQPIHELLLGLKKKGFAQGKINGFGGKVMDGETIEAAAIRELAEETGVQVELSHLDKVAHLAFVFPARPAWNQVVHVFLVTEWAGQPAESEEMRPAWYAVDQIPYPAMWHDDTYWLPLVLDGQKVRATFTYQDDNETVAGVRWGES